MGKVPKNGFCYISVNKMLRMTSQYLARQLTELLFSGIFRVAVAPTLFALQSAPTPIATKLIQLVVMSSGFIFNSSFTNCTFQFSAK